MKKILSLVILLITTFNCLGQQKKVDSLKEVFRLAKTSHKKMEVSAKILEISYYASTKDFSTFLDSLQYYSHATNNVKHIGHYFRFKGIAEIRKSNFKQAKLNLKKAEKQYTQTKDIPDLVSIYTNLATVYKRERKRDSAILYYKKSISLTRDFFDTKNILSNHIAHYNLAIVYHTAGENNTALKHLDTAITKVKQTDKRNYEASSLYLMGTIYGALGNKKRAVEILERAIPIFKEYGEYNYLLASVNNMALHQNDDEAIESYKYVINELKELGKNYHLSATAYNNLAQRLITKKAFDDARKYLDTAYSLAQSLKNKREVGKTLKIQGDLAFEENRNIPQAIEYYNSALEILLKTKNIKEQRIVYNKLQRSYARIRKYDKAYSAMANYVILNDSIYNKENAKVIEEMSTKYETEKKEKELALERASNKELELDNAQLNNLFYTIGSLIFIALIILFFYLRSKKQQIENERQKSSLEINRLEKEVNDFENEWALRNSKDETFIISIQEKFYTHLKEYFNIPDLLVRFWNLQATSGLTEKEISETMEIPFGTIDGQRQRLYKKLSLKMNKKYNRNSSVALYLKEYKKFVKKEFLRYQAY